MLVAVDRHRALATSYLHRRDLAGEEAALLRCLGTHLRAICEGVLIGASHLEVLGDVLGRLRHGVHTVLRLHQRIDEAPAYGGVIHLGRAGKRFGRLAHDERRTGHAFDAAGEHQFGITGADRARRAANRVEAGTAQPVDCGAGYMLRQPCQQRRHARDVAVVLAGLVGTAIDHVVKLIPIDGRVALLQHTHRMRSEVIRADILEHTAVPADRRADEVADIGVGHGDPPGLRLAVGVSHRVMAGKNPTRRSAPSPRQGQPLEPFD